MALLILALLQRIFLMSSLMLLLVWLIFFMVLIKLLPILGDRKSGSAGMPRPISYAVFCLKKKSVGRQVAAAAASRRARAGTRRSPILARDAPPRHQPPHQPGRP